MARADDQASWKCGRCSSENFYLKTEEPTDTCQVCGYKGMTRRNNLLPPDVRLDISQY